MYTYNSECSCIENLSHEYISYFLQLATSMQFTVSSDPTEIHMV